MPDILHLIQILGVELMVCGTIWSGLNVRVCVCVCVCVFSVFVLILQMWWKLLVNALLCTIIHHSC